MEVPPEPSARPPIDVGFVAGVALPEVFAVSVVDVGTAEAAYSLLQC